VRASRRCLVLALALGGCADVCERAAAVAADLATAGAACGVGTSPLSLDVAACRATLPRCSGDDLGTIGEYEDCVTALPECTPATRADFNARLTACATPMAALGRGCLAP